jgi:hypothetical protein
MYMSGALSDPHLTLFALTDPLGLTIIVSRPSAQIFGRGRTPADTKAQRLAWMLAPLYEKVIPRTLRPPLDELVPTQDERFTDKNNSLVAIAGLTRFAEPSLALTDENGNPVAIWVADLGGGMRILCFDDWGRKRVEVDLGPDAQPVPSVQIIEIGDADNPDHDDRVALDPSRLTEVPFSPPTDGEIPWLAGKFKSVTLPVTLIDQRSKVLWRSK